MKIKSTDGTEYEIAADAQVVPYLTKNIVKLTDVVEGSECMVWQNADDVVEKVMVFAE